MKKNQFALILAISLVYTAHSVYAEGHQDKRTKEEIPDIHASIQINKGEPKDYLDQIIPLNKMLEMVTTSEGAGTQVLSIDLEDKNKNLVYAVELSDSRIELFDAGKGTKLYSGKKEVEDRDGKEDNEEGEED